MMGTGTIIFIFVLELVSFPVFFLVLSRRFSRRRILADLRAEMDRLIADLGREADRDVAILENRIKSLRSLIEEADRRVLVAGREERRRQDSVEISEVAFRPPAPVASREAVRAAQAESPRATVASGVVAESAPEPAQEPITIYTRPRFSRSENQIEPIVPVKERVIELARKGISAEMIASMVSLSLGEVELIIAMNVSSE